MKLKVLIQFIGEILIVLTVIVAYKFNFVEMKYPRSSFNDYLMSFYLFLIVIELVLIYEYYSHGDQD